MSTCSNLRASRGEKNKSSILFFPVEFRGGAPSARELKGKKAKKNVAGLCLSLPETGAIKASKRVKGMLHDNGVAVKTSEKARVYAKCTAKDSLQCGCHETAFINSLPNGKPFVFRQRLSAFDD